MNTHVTLMLPDSHDADEYGMTRKHFENAEMLASYLTTPDIAMRRSIFIDKKEYVVHAHSIFIDTKNNEVNVHISMREPS